MRGIFRSKVVKVLAGVIVVVLVVVGASNAVFNFIGSKHQAGTQSGYEWSKENAFTDENIQEIDMGKDDFKIMAITDVHIRNNGTFGAAFGVNLVLDGMSEIQLKKMIKKEQPNLIVVTGDTVLTTWNDISLKKFSDFMDSFKIPWAHIYGNHEIEGRADKRKLSEILDNSEYGMFTYGPEDMNGAGNYVINLKRGNSIEYSLFLFDDGEDIFKNNERTYGSITPKLIDWYKWNTSGINQLAGKNVKQIAFMHVPIPEYKNVSESDFIHGVRKEDGGSSDFNYGFFNEFKANGGTHIFAGHDHVNNFMADYQGVKLAYVNKSTYNCYFTSEALGSTIITIDSGNNAQVKNINFKGEKV